ncbi:MAG: hypothetical protein RIQ93_1487 [Verrucomicrobiota bacterium]|jgi:hypothetical protein
MTPTFQTTAALLIVALVAAAFVVRAIKRRRNPGCGGGDCGAISPEMRKLQARIKLK